MSRPRYRWWGYVRWCIQDYPNKCRELDDMHRSGSRKNDGMPTRSGEARPTERLAMRGFTGQKEREYEAVKKTVDLTLTREDGEDVLHLVELVLWKRTHTIEGAAHHCRMSTRTAYRRYREFVYAVGAQMGYLD